MKNNRLIFALARAAAALIAAVILLGCTGWAFLYLLGEPEKIMDGAALTDGAYVTADVDYIMDICGVDRADDTGEITAYYAVTPIGTQFAVVRFPASDGETLESFEAETRLYLYGQQKTVSTHMSVTGMARTLPEDVSPLLSGWFLDVKNRMIGSGMIAEVQDYSIYLCPCMIDADSLGAVSAGAAVTMTVIAAVLAVYAVLEIVLILCGVYKKKGGGHA